jgi:hypothetical protein
MHENYEVSSNLRELLLANNLISLLDNKSMVYVPNNSEE